MSPNPIQLVSLKKGGNLETDMHIGINPCECEDRDWGDALQATEHQRLQANHQKPGERPQIESPSQPSEGVNTANTSILNFYPRTVTH